MARYCQGGIKMNELQAIRCFNSRRKRREKTTKIHALRNWSPIHWLKASSMSWFRSQRCNRLFNSKWSKPWNKENSKHWCPLADFKKKTPTYAFGERFWDRSMLKIFCWVYWKTPRLPWSFIWIVLNILCSCLLWLSDRYN